MVVHIRNLILTLSYSLVNCVELLDLPLCPQSINFFPSNLPMHCRMPSKDELPSTPRLTGLRAARSAGYSPVPFPPPPAPVPAMPPMPPMPPMPGMPMPMPIIPPNGAQKLPIIVMPFYSPESAHKSGPAGKDEKPYKPTTRKPNDGLGSGSSSDDSDLDSSSSTDDSCDSRDDGFWRSKGKAKRKSRRSFSRRMFGKHHKKHYKKGLKVVEVPEILTPILQYVTKDGYVIFEKQISKHEAERWLTDSEFGVPAKKEDNQIEQDHKEKLEPMKDARRSTRNKIKPEKPNLVKYDRENVDGTKVLVKRRRNHKLQPIATEQKQNDMTDTNT